MCDVIRFPANRSTRPVGSGRFQREDGATVVQLAAVRRDRQARPVQAGIAVAVPAGT